MNRSQAITFSVILGFLILGLMTVIFLLLFPYQQFFSVIATQTPTPLPTATPSPTIERFLPTPSLTTPTPAPPTPTNTRVPTPFPTQPKLPTPTVVFSGFPTAIAPPTATVRPAPVRPNATATPAVATPPVVDRQYSVTFSAQATELLKGECTRLEWDVTGSTQVRLQGQDVEPSGSEKVCPERTTAYTLEVQLPGSARIDRQKVQIRVQ